MAQVTAPAMWEVTIYFSWGPETYYGSKTQMIKQRAQAISTGHAVSGIKECK